jgi:hypothetical protein
MIRIKKNPSLSNMDDFRRFVNERLTFAFSLNTEEDIQAATKFFNGRNAKSEHKSHSGHTTDLK